MSQSEFFLIIRLGLCHFLSQLLFRFSILLGLTALHPYFAIAISPRDTRTRFIAIADQATKPSR
ncbi:hypothetical protein BDV33DRAFT_180403, partial [Aspergillus novoparasiticus]